MIEKTIKNYEGIFRFQYLLIQTAAASTRKKEDQQNMHGFHFISNLKENNMEYMEELNMEEPITIFKNRKGVIYGPELY